jgi:hypothetical protein
MCVRMSVVTSYDCRRRHCLYRRQRRRHTAVDAAVTAITAVIVAGTDSTGTDFSFSET